MNPLVVVLYILAFGLFIYGLMGLTGPRTAVRGNLIAAAGMAVALVATIALAVDHDISGAGLALLVAAMLVGAAIGLWRARVVEMTGMPELIALLHSFVGLAAVLVLAGFVGFAVISKVPNTLHTPLMSGTNAIHGIVVLGGFIVLGLGAEGVLNKVLLVIAIAFGTINVVGGFLVTDRMLGMFKEKKDTTK